jgi:hypothetical protein
MIQGSAGDSHDSMAHSACRDIHSVRNGVGLLSKLFGRKNDATTDSPSVSLESSGVRITASFGGAVSPSIRSEGKPDPSCGPYYVYVHEDANGKIFYVGKGTKRRAWSQDRDLIWHRYVDDYLKGIYRVRIVSYHATEEDALSAEDQWIARYGPQIVNWVNPCRNDNWRESVEYHRRNRINQEFITETRSLETSDPTLAIERYKQALTVMYEISRIVTERSFVAEIYPEVNAPRRDDNLMDRITLCLLKAKRYQELCSIVDDYERLCPSIYCSKKRGNCLRRREKARLALASNEKIIPPPSPS